MLLEWGSPGHVASVGKILHVWSFYWAYLFDSSCFMHHIYIYTAFIFRYKIRSVINDYISWSVIQRRKSHVYFFQGTMPYPSCASCWGWSTLNIRLRCKGRPRGKKGIFRCEEMDGFYGVWEVPHLLSHVQRCELNVWFVGRRYHDCKSPINRFCHMELVIVMLLNDHKLPAPGSMNIGTIWQNV